MREYLFGCTGDSAQTLNCSKLSRKFRESVAKSCSLDLLLILCRPFWFRINAHEQLRRSLQNSVRKMVGVLQVVGEKNINKFLVIFLCASRERCFSDEVMYRNGMGRAVICTSERY